MISLGAQMPLAGNSQYLVSSGYPLASWGWSRILTPAKIKQIWLLELRWSLSFEIYYEGRVPMERRKTIQVIYELEADLNNNFTPSWWSRISWHLGGVASQKCVTVPTPCLCSCGVQSGKRGSHWLFSLFEVPCLPLGDHKPSCLHLLIQSIVTKCLQYLIASSQLQP